MNRFITIPIFLVLLNQLVYAQGITSTYIKKEYMVPMRDGICLHTIVYTPGDQQETLPFLFCRTPYGIRNVAEPDRDQFLKELADEGYIFVFQDIRGRYGSEGEFEMMRFPRNKQIANSTDESTDAFDTFEWLLHNIPHNNGKAGMYGGSYDAWLAVMAAREPHPCLKAITEQGMPGDMYLGDDFHHNGAFRLSYGFEYAFMQEGSKEGKLFSFDRYDTYDWYLKLGPLANVNRFYFHEGIPTWNNFINHPDYDSFWKKQSVNYLLDTPRVPVLHVAGWWDQEDFYGPLAAYAKWEKKDKGHLNYFVAGPWNHGGWAYGTGKKLGNIEFDSLTTITFRHEIQAPWFAWYLKGKGNGNFLEARIFQTGSNNWVGYDQWPPTVQKTQNIYLQGQHRLSFKKPNAKYSKDSYISDPEHPVPYRPRPIEATYSATSRWFNWLVEDQRFVQDRPDVISWESETLESDLTITGKISATLYAATTGTDADWVVKLIDVYPDQFPKNPKLSGYQLMIAGEVFRGRYRYSFEKPVPIHPGVIETYQIDLHQANHVFKRGHRIMIQIQSSWFPVFDRNPQVFVRNIFTAIPKDFKKATQTIFHSIRYPSHIVLPIIP